MANIFLTSKKNDIRTYDIRKTATRQGKDYTTSCVLDYPCFKENYTIIAIYLSKQQALGVYPKPIQQFDFTGNLHCAGNTLFIIEEVRETLEYSLDCIWYFILC